MLYAVKRPFKSLGKFYKAGSIITDPASIKYFRDKIDEGIVVLVTEQNHGAVGHYLEQRAGIENAATKLKAKLDKLSGKPEVEAKPIETKLKPKQTPSKPKEK